MQKNVLGNGNMPFRASCRWREKFLKRKIVINASEDENNQNLPFEFETKLIEFECLVSGLC
jgi:hypothetical protein